MQNDLGEHAVRSRQGTDPDRSGSLLTLRDSLKELSEIIQRGRQYDLIIRAGRQLEFRNPNDLTDDMRINRNDVIVHRGLKNQPTVIILHDLKICIKQADQSGENYTGTVVEVTPVVGLDDIMNAV
jgi:hypothetical protein